MIEPIFNFYRMTTAEARNHAKKFAKDGQFKGMWWMLWMTIVISVERKMWSILHKEEVKWTQIAREAHQKRKRTERLDRQRQQRIEKRQGRSATPSRKNQE
jgi:hypothetical protein